MKKKLLYIIGVILAWGSLASCSSDFLKEYSQDLARVQSVDDLKELLVGDCLMPKGLFDNSKSYYEVVNPNYLFLHFMSDELQENLVTQDDVDYVGNKYREVLFPYFTWQQHLFLNQKGQSSYESNEDAHWTLAYEKINNCNMVLDAADQLKTTSEEEVEEVTKVKGELYFLRASYYLMLVNLYGKPYAPQTASTDLSVPIKTTSNVEDKEYQRASVAAVYDQVVSDLNEAEKLLENASAPASIYHPGIESVYILHSRVGLYMQDWETAEQYAKKAIEKNAYLLDLKSFPEGSFPMNRANEEVVFSNGSSCLGNVLFQDPGNEDSYYEVSPVWYISDNLYALFPKNDKRKTIYMTTEDDITNHLPTYHKIENRRSAYGIYKEVSDVFSIRTAEAYLNLAEAEAQMGNSQEACSWLDKLRAKRVEDAEPLSLTGEELITFVREERERELFLEGHRWFDLRRYTVDVNYPYSKVIEHSMSTFKTEDYQTYRSNVSRYRLEKNDAAYTLDIPQDEKEFQPSLGSNERPVRRPFSSEDFSSGSDEDEDW